MADSTAGGPSELDTQVIAPGVGKPGVELDYPPSAPPAKRAHLTEDDVAEQFVTSNIDEVRFEPGAGRWLFWSGMRWKEDTTGRTYDLMRQLCRTCRSGSKEMSSDSAVRGAESMAQKDQRIVVEQERWDRDPMLLGTPGGTVDLVSGEIKLPARDNHITKLTMVTPAPLDTPCPLFDAFLDQVTGGDTALQRFLLQFAGYALTGMTNAQSLLFIHGAGGNGKSVLQGLLAEIMGDYAKTAAPQTFVATKQPRHLTELAMLSGARLVISSETDKDEAWSEARINQLTGGDIVTANRMRQDHFHFKPQFKLIFIGNHKPKLQTVNDAARRRFNIVPFNHKPTQVDPELAEKLRGEYPAILRKIIAGSMDWQKNGLLRPDVVLNATKAYFEEQDLVGRWIDERCNTGPSLKATAKSLFEDWKTFAAENNEQLGTSTSFASLLKGHGIQSKKSGTTIYLGVALKSQTALANHEISSMSALAEKL